ncbi:hypothetical protein BD770DRAFT_378770 [Pilaira anomala]|nr:hypothetical protein BD770DRAFT_378770 [Pilaira anomala]
MISSQNRVNLDPFDSCPAYAYTEKSPAYSTYSDKYHPTTTTYYHNSKPSHMRLSLRKIKTSFKTFLFDKGDRREKRPQDGKTNPME